MLDWNRLLCGKRLRSILADKIPGDRPKRPGFVQTDFRLEQERDHDRILFSTPFRRLGDKTQVFPLESIESIRTRLTHSYEVANLARSLGLRIATSRQNDLPINAIRTIPAMLAAAGLAHDIGNPPFGHQGESAIRAWFVRNRNLFEPKDGRSLSEQCKRDFLLFEGNAQTLRVLTKLQVIEDDLGLNITVGTLAALMKYVAPSHKVSNSEQPRKKVGYFATEESLVNLVREEVGLEGYARHPLALIMEACDDIAYSVVDAEDAIKKGIVSLNDLIADLKHTKDATGGKDKITNDLCEQTQIQLEYLRNRDLREQKLHPNELNDIATQKFRVYAIQIMVSAVYECFEANYNNIMSGKFNDELIKQSYAAPLCAALKGFDKENAFIHKSVLEIELDGYNILNRLMDYLWMGISDREKRDQPGSKRCTPFAAYVYSRISENYRRIFENKFHGYHENVNLPIRYRELQLLTDMVSGMTDQFCLDLFSDLDRRYRKMEKIDGN